MNPLFQGYLNGKASRVEHAIISALLAKRLKHPVVQAWITACHHTGLQNESTFIERMKEHDQDSSWQVTLDLAHQWFLQQPSPRPTLSEKWKLAHREKQVKEIWIRMLYSCLIDADHLNTEAHFRQQDAHHRQRPSPSLPNLWETFSSKQNTWMEKQPDTPLNRARTELYYRCLTAALSDLPMTLLNAPTGWGKSRAGLGYALHHAIVHQKSRLIVVIPYTSIVQQTAALYRNLLGEDAVIEHHAMVQEGTSEIHRWQRFAIENWDAPVIVTTTVQFFNSLFDRRPSAVRKLHNITNSIVILDEVQMLPFTLLRPIRSMMEILMKHFGVSFLCSSATPFTERVWQTIEPERPLAIQTINLPVINEDRPRVELDLSWLKKEVTWEEIVTEMSNHKQVLVVVNTRKEARILFSLVSDVSYAIHLSRWMCGKHIQRQIRRVRLMLRFKLPVWVVSTSLIEVGVDLDFPFGMRAESPLDRLIQVMGRINRDAKRLPERVLWFRPKGTWFGTQQHLEVQHTRTFLEQYGTQAVAPSCIEDYFLSLVRSLHLDKHSIEDLRRNKEFGIMFEDIADTVKIIDEDEGGKASLLVLYDKRAEKLYHTFHQNQKPTKEWMRAIQPYLISIRADHLILQDSSKTVYLLSELFLWKGGYDNRLGVIV